MKVPSSRRAAFHAVLLLPTLIASVLLLPQLSADVRANPCVDASCGNTTTIIPVGAQYISLALDTQGKPIVAYVAARSQLGLLHCGNATCTEGNVISALETNAQYTSLRLDAEGFPVIAYYSASAADLRIVHCNDENCAGGDEDVASPDTGGDVGRYSSLALDAAGRPVVAYLDSTNADLKVLHCGDSSCALGNSITSPDTAGALGEWTSLELDSSGNPVVAYHDDAANDLKLLHCNDPNCSSGGDSIVTPDGEGDVGSYSSLDLDSAGRPVVSYRDVTHFDLRLLRCGNANCSAGNAITSPDTTGAVGSFSSLTIDGADNPVVSYWDASHSRLKVLHCGNPTCGANNAVAAPDDDLNSTAPLGQFTSIALDSNGRPAVAYTRTSGVGLGILRCIDAGCAAKDFDSDGCQDAQENMTAPGSEVGGGLRDPKNPWDYFNPTGDGRNRLDDVLAVVAQYYEHEFLRPPNPPSTLNPAYTPGTDRTYLGPNRWNLGPPNGRQNVGDIIAARNSFMHDCF